ncbi:GGDEF domain-containing protein [Pseudoalteromonas mariniglutinosa]|uniref:GGDEF domain-containing protein n=1 Tax=Pseudoalteromonas mariniglutinosa TaxID=206042 RepID=UPI00384FA6A7
MDVEPSMAYSGACLKQAIPLMVKYKMPITPLNYAVWYCYISQRNIALNKELDAFLEVQQNCTHEQAKYLFDKYLSSEDLSLFYRLSDGFDNVINRVHQGISDTLVRSNHFTNRLQQCQQRLSISDLSEAGALDEVLDCVARLSDESIELQHHANHFQHQLASAYAEIKDLKNELLSSKAKAEVDKLTGLFNRGKFDEDMQAFCQQNRLKSPQVAILAILDIDHFKQFNDLYGHQKGDDVLKRVAKKLVLCADNKVRVYRYGGEEFCLTGKFSSISEAVNFVQKMRQSIAGLVIKDSRKSKVVGKVTASFGIAIKAVNSKPDKLIAKADKALYLAKEHGRNRVEVIAE